MIAALVLAEDLRAQIAREARAAYPRECCGLIEGYRDGARVIATALHPARNIAEDSDRFEIDPAQHIALLRALRGTAHDIVGCYHSHPNGRAEPSERDRDAVTESGFIWIIAGCDPNGVCLLSGFAATADNFCPVRLQG